MTPDSTARRTARGNRWGLALIGAVLAVAGVLGLLAGSGLLRQRFAGAEPAPWPADVGALSTLLPYALLVAAVLIGLLALRWMLVQGRSETVRRLAIEPESVGGTTEISASAAQDVFQDEVGAYPGVHRARARMTESARAPRLRLDLTVDDDADIAALWRRVRSDALEELRTALELDQLPAVMRLSTAAPPKNPRRNPE
ncbi:alkaline shock response membrane anchor protein AmaP [Streptomonospora algeriensis]|uniref:Alkaline shock response membrane anchor protein AmaP n=1 Tax=Streptomonospora algeriensis TaxID=995084 RepID=A0ABW3BLK8_9ACTN